MEERSYSKTAFIRILELMVYTQIRSQAAYKQILGRMEEIGARFSEAGVKYQRSGWRPQVMNLTTRE